MFADIAAFSDISVRGGAIMQLRVWLALLSICVVLLWGCSDRERLSSGPIDDTILPEWTYGTDQTYDVPAEPGGRITDPTTGAVFRFPDGGTGQLTIRALETGPQTALDEGAFEIVYEGPGALELLLEHDAEDYDFLVGYSPLSAVILEGEELDTSGWLPIRHTELLGDTLVFELSAGTNKNGSPSLPWSGVKKFKSVRYKKGTAQADLYAQIEQNVRDALTSLIAAVPASRRAQVMLDVNGPFEPVLYVPQNRSAYLFTSKPKYIPYWDSFGFVSQCAIVIPDDATGSVAHEVGHYLHHVLLGNSGYLPFFQNVRPSGHHVGMAGALNELIEEPAYFAEYYLKGTVGGAGPERGTFLTNGGGGSISPTTVDYRDLEGMTISMLASVIRESGEIRNYANELVKVPVVTGSRDQLWQDCYEIIAMGTRDVLTARTKVETLLQASGQADKLPAMLQAIGWNHHVVCRFVDDDGNPVSGVTARAVSKVGTTEYRLPTRSRESGADGTYGLGQFFPGASVLRVYYDGDSLDVPQTIPWTTPTNIQVDLGDVNVVGNALLRKLQRCTVLDFDFSAPQVYSDGDSHDAFRRTVRSVVWDGFSFTSRDSVDAYSEHIWLTVSGNVGSDGQSLTVEYWYRYEHNFPVGIDDVVNTHVRVQGVPYMRDYLQSGNQVVQYVVSGSGVEHYVIVLESNFVRTDEDGIVVDGHDYVSTDWSPPGDTIVLDLVFREE
jgi:hypothetical protein